MTLMSIMGGKFSIMDEVFTDSSILTMRGFSLLLSGITFTDFGLCVLIKLELTSPKFILMA